MKRLLGFWILMYSIAFSQPIPGTVTINSVCTDSLGTQWAGTSDGIYKSINGNDWQKVQLPVTGNIGQIIATKSNFLCAKSSNCGVIISTNNGSSWVAIPGIFIVPQGLQPPACVATQSFITVNNIIWCEPTIKYRNSPAGFFSPDSAKNWQPFYDATSLGDSKSIKDIYVTDDHLYITTEFSSDDFNLFRINNKGLKKIWSKTNPYLMSIQVKINDPTIIITGIDISLGPSVARYISYDSGDTWMTAAVPVELFNFTAQCGKDGITLKWETLSESNNYGFEIQRKNNGDWNSLSFIPGNGTTNKHQNYAFIDRRHQDGKYRLKQIDTNGTFAYSQEIEVHQTIFDFSLSQNHPNPFNTSTTIEFSLPRNDNVSLKIYSLEGKEITEVLTKHLSSGKHRIVWNAQNCASGIYYMILETGSQKLIRKAVLVK